MYKYIVVDKDYNNVVDTIWADSADHAREVFEERCYNDNDYALYVKVGG